IYDAAADAAAWPAFLDAFKQAIRAKAAALWIQDVRQKQALMSWGAGLTGADLQVYLERDGHSDPIPDVVETLSDGYGIVAVFLKTGARQCIISATRGSDDEAFGETDQSFLQVLVPHLRRAALLQTELSLLRSERSALTQSLDRLSHALVLTDAEGRLVF